MPKSANSDERFPSAYQEGSVEFFYRKFKTDERALIPRLETESLARKAISFAREEEFDVLVDVGCGSGVLAVTIGLEVSFSQVIALDVSLQALSLARENARMNGLEATFLQSDLLSAFKNSDWGASGTEFIWKPFHAWWFSNELGSEVPSSPSVLFVANLPYVRDHDPDVSPDTAFEPQNALYGGSETGFEMTARFIGEFEAFVARFPLGRFRVLCEVGDDHEPQIEAIAKKYGRFVEIFSDLRGIRRFFTYSVWIKGI